MTALNIDSGMTAGSAEAGLPDDARLASGQFRAFYAELVKVREQAQTLAADGPAHAAALSERLVQVIELQSLESRRLMGVGGLAVDAQARFLKAALADEFMLNLEGPGRSAWHEHLIEARLFRSSLAGEKVFQTIDDLLARRDPRDRALALMHLHTLSLGFQGRLRGQPQMPQEIERMRSALFRLAYQRDPDLHASAALLGTSAYQHTVTHRPQQRLPRLSRRTVVFVSVMLALLLISQAVWMWQTWPVRQMLRPDAERSSAPRTGWLLPGAEARKVADA